MTAEITTGIVAQRQDWFVGGPGDWTPLRGRVTYPSRAQVMELAVQLARPVEGHIIEFGVWKGHSVRVARDELWRSAVWDGRQRRKRIYACDSFEGLPENYEHLPAGTFATAVPRLTGVRVVQGFFDRSLTPQLAQEIGRVSLAHFDADLYSSTVTALDWVAPLLHDGSLLVFDEFGGEDPAEERALAEWVDRTGTRVALLALFGREPSGQGEQTDRRAIFQVVGDTALKKAPPLLPTRLRRRLLADR
jgi:hypothetical protein